MADGAQHDEQVRAACIQFDVERGDVDRNERRAESRIREAAAAGAHLVVLPEMWTTSFLETYSDALLQRSAEAEERLKTVARELDLLAVGSAPHAGAGGIENRAQLIDRGEVLGTYAKIHLFSPNLEHRHHVAGSTPLIVDTRFGRIGVVICYDIRFPELMRHFFVEGCDLLVVPAQWPEARADHWRVLLRARAIENQLFVIGCNRTGAEPSLRRHADRLVFPGDSRIIDPMGTVLAAGAGQSAAVLADVELRRVRAMRRILPVAKDRRPDVYSRLWTGEPAQRLTRDD
ncbi:MAG: carbon-nitrogen family hydrolase [Planctomycetes bacterium]|nr:carbon-nitrogen family hydrolase [Planctomycetota bacterium]